MLSVMCSMSSGRSKNAVCLRNFLSILNTSLKAMVKVFVHVKREHSGTFTVLLMCRAIFNFCSSLFFCACDFKGARLTALEPSVPDFSQE